VYNGTIIHIISIIAQLYHLSHPYDAFRFCLLLIIKHNPYDIIMHIISLITILTLITIITLITLNCIVVISCIQWWEVEGSRGGMPPSITAKYIRETLASSTITPFSQFCLTNLLGFCLNITHIALKASIFRNCPQTEVTLMCTEPFLMITYKPFVIL
jgi:hypothetical protein